MSKLDGKTLDIEEQNIEKLKQLFPEIDTDGKIDFDKLKQVLGEYVDDSDERYNFKWNGKGEALRLSQTPSMGTLRPAPEEGESKNWDETENLYIEGDNLEVLKLLQKSYFGKIKMIYIDPPYNTGNDFVYPDNFKDNIKNYKKLTGQVDDEGKATNTNKEYSGRYHTDWLNMMYPRLRLARNLLTDDGVIFISIDDNEVHNMRKICDEIFSEDNFINQLIIESGEVFGQKSAHADKRFIKVKDYILVYGKNKLKINDKKPLYTALNNIYDSHYNTVLDSNLNKKTLKEYILINDKLNKKFESYNLDINECNINKLINLDNEFKSYFIKNISKKLYQDQPYSSKLPDNISKKLRNDNILEYKELYLFRTKTGSIRYYKPFTDALRCTDDYVPILTRSTIRGDLWKDFHYDMRNITKEGNIKFENGKKPKRLIKQLIKWMNIKESDIILDFFAGSSTTAHAVMELNAENDGNIKYIMVQLPEPTDEKSEAYKAGYENIAEIGKERIRRSGDKVKSELKEKYEMSTEEERRNIKNPEELDIGFKVFKLNSSNIKEWNPGKYDDIQMAIEDSSNPYVEGRTEEDVVYEMILKMGLDLTYPVEKHEINGKTIYSVGYGLLMICLSDNIDLTVAQKMIEIKDENNQEEFRVIFRDEGFNSDTDKTNIKETLKSAGLAAEAFITL